MKVLFLINSLKNRSGTERVACILANLFDEELKCEVSIINRDTEKNNVAYALNDNIEVLKISGSYFSFYNGLNDYIGNYKPDYIIVHNMGKLTLLTCFLKKNSVKKIISFEHVAFNIRPQWVKSLAKILYKRVDQVVTLTNNDKLSYVDFHNNVVKINNISPYDVSYIDYQYNTNSKQVIAIGRLTYQKNFEALIKAWSLFSQTFSDWSLLIYGKGEDQDNLQNLIELKKLNNVFLKGESSNLEEIYKSSSFFIMSSRFEGLPMVLIEAQSFGLPIISFNCPHGPSDIIEHNINGILVENQNIEELAMSILTLIQSPEKRSFFSVNAYDHAKVFSKNEIVKEWEKVLC